MKVKEEKTGRTKVKARTIQKKQHLEKRSKKFNEGPFSGKGPGHRSSPQMGREKCKPCASWERKRKKNLRWQLERSINDGGVTFQQLAG